MTFVRNPNYWNAPKPYLDKVLVKFIPDPEQQVNALLKGEIDWTRLAYPDVSRVKAASSDSHVTVMSRDVKAPETMVLDLNTTKGPLKNADVRKALYTAIDRGKIVKDAYHGYAQASRSAIPTDFKTLYDPSVDYTKTYAFDADKAGQMLDDAGYPMKDGKRLSLTLSFITANAEYPFDSVARIVAAQWKDIGVDVKLEGLDPQVWTDKVYKRRDFDVSMISLTGRTDPVFGVDRSFLCNDKQLPYVNPTGYCDPQLDAVALKAQQTAEDQRQALYKQYEQILSDALPQLPLASADVFEAVSSKFGGLDTQFDLAFNGHPNWAEAWRG
jgi:peptide/nickel transport system substrate-binding protein